MLSQVLRQVNRTEGAFIDLTTPERTVYGMEEPEESPLPEEEPAESEEGAENAPQETEAPNETENEGN